MKPGVHALAALLVLGAAFGMACEDEETPEGLEAPGTLVPESGEVDDQTAIVELGNLQVAYNGSADVSGEDSVLVRIGGSRAAADEDAFSFTPTFLEGTPGQRLTLEIENNSGERHNITVRDAGIDVDIPVRETVEVEVTIPASGGTLFYCKFHTLAGMNGQLLPLNATPAPVEVTPTAAPMP